MVSAARDVNPHLAQITELRAVAASRDVSRSGGHPGADCVWTAEGRKRKDVGKLAGVVAASVSVLDGETALIVHALVDESRERLVGGGGRSGTVWMRWNVPLDERP